MAASFKVIVSEPTMGGIKSFVGQEAFNLATIKANNC